jgi:hypothetical protein
MDVALNDLSLAMGKVTHCFSAYRRECQRLIEEIGTCSRSDADEKFDMLVDIIGKLSKAWFVLDVNIGSDLESLVRNCERLQEPYAREYWYKRFQSGERWPNANST